MAVVTNMSYANYYAEQRLRCIFKDLKILNRSGQLNNLAHLYSRVSQCVLQLSLELLIKVVSEMVI